MKTFRQLATALAIAAALPAAAADEFEPALRSYLEAQIMPWVNDPVIVEAVRAQNRTTAGYSQDQIDALDADWRASVGDPATPQIAAVLANPAADFLRNRIEIAGGAITEIFVMDARGLNVAASAVTSDYWQGDEDKFRETFPKGPGATHVGEVEFDESSQTYQGQVSLVITDPVTREPLGAITVGVDPEALL